MATKRAFARSGLEVDLVWKMSAVLALEYLRDVIASKSKTDLPSLLILDVNMPGMGGFELLDALEADARLRQLPVIMFSGSNDPVQVDRALGAQANSFIRRPDDFDELVEIVESLGRYWLHTTEAPPSLAK